MALLLSHSPPLPARTRLLSKTLISKSTPFIPSIPAPTPLNLPSFTSKTPKLLNPKILTPSSSSSFADPTFDFDDGEEIPVGSPWDGAVIYKRDASAPHVEYCTTLERLGLARLSTDVSKSRASAMGIRLPPRRAKEAELGGDGTPVLVSVDVTRRKRRLKLDGIVRTVITLGCNRCGEPAAEGVFSNFSLLLTEDPINESDDEINMGVIYGDEKHKSSTGNITEEDEEDEKEIDRDDRLYFPSEEREIDISKPIRDLVHLEITLNAVCDANCKGLCLRCGMNLNKRRCSCSRGEAQEGDYGPLKNLRKQMQSK
ncbi:uncharacterized protein A4U43_C01F10680 [Asparagus officinalis]|uniref:Large ribosomal RNA subunit accumulation protein YCED homolog 1, chloroplastic n=1 Tax=Asparagus officinalis TaxID=4686 RepID=A0A5P1FNZ8_ASPOF|nr:uncharacterized protein LOC109821118 [Asparagus officinalis]ONK79842.1 uncharacterized protein A4U43_C01F10680 [Asparagus officinalis]